MQVFTSCFKFAKGLDSGRYFVVSISRFPLKWFNGYRCYEFAPSAALLKSFKAGLSQIMFRMFGDILLRNCVSFHILVFDLLCFYYGFYYVFI